MIFKKSSVAPFILMALLVTLSSADVYGVERKVNNAASAEYTTKKDLFNAAGEGNLLKLQSLFENNRQTITEEAVSWALNSAAEKGHLDIIKYLLSQNVVTPTPEMVGGALMSAVFESEMNIWKYLCSQECPIKPSPADVGGALEAALDFTYEGVADEYSYLDVVKFMCSKDCSVPPSQDAVKRVLIRAAKQSIGVPSKRPLDKREALQIVQFLLSKDCSVQPIPDAVGQVFAALIRYSNPETRTTGEQEWLDLFSVIIENPENAAALCNVDLLNEDLLNELFSNTGVPDNVVLMLSKIPSSEPVLKCLYTRFLERKKEINVNVLKNGLRGVTKTPKLNLLKTVKSTKENKKSLNSLIKKNMLPSVSEYL